MNKLVKSAEYICIATNQIGMTYSTNEFGAGPLLSTFNEPLASKSVCWKDDTFQKWLDGEKIGRRRVLRAPSAERVMIDESNGELHVEMVRILSPGFEDFEAYAARCGCKSFEEAEDGFGELAWVYDKFYVLVKGTEVREFLTLVVPYCWVCCF